MVEKNTNEAKLRVQKERYQVGGNRRYSNCFSVEYTKYALLSLVSPSASSASNVVKT